MVFKENDYILKGIWNSVILQRDIKTRVRKMIYYWRRWDGGSESPKSSEASLGGWAWLSLPFIQARQGPWIGSPRVGVLKKSRRWSGTEGPIVENPPEAHKGRQGFSSRLPNRLAIFPAWKWGGGGGGWPFRTSSGVLLRVGSEPSVSQADNIMAIKGT